MAAPRGASWLSPGLTSAPGPLEAQVASAAVQAMVSAGQVQSSSCRQHEASIVSINSSIV